ncbi:trehalose-6-phosphate hydrolase [Flavobacterium sp. CF108]|uniref:alpha-glucosidase n=1 Tax=unclassified Flavobacterium TaxID=196869 RepID=UPI0008BBBE71|nr:MULTISPECIES: alpha-glucosidase [unclassified Flavobacterium]SEP34114.1 trehalose-6-phosphate hydrolase [Flavobacterium sp. fv08]SHG65556.1 trehalose-6-phosphate hydrolase [Flavobacterium sp. CF108]
MDFNPSFAIIIDNNAMKSNTFNYILILLIILNINPAIAQKTADKKWWKESVFYQIYMPSYADSNGDGYGDFKGMTQKLDYLKELGIKGIWLTPFLTSPKVDNGYDIANYYEVDPTYGTKADFDIFLKEAHKRGIKVIIDMVLNHTSTDCKWFQESRKSKDNPYRDYYIWKDEPNNWESFFGGTAWEKDAPTNQYYYHKFDKRMADLNWSNPKVVAEVQKILRFWLDAGVDGFRLDVINFLTTNGITKDNPIKNGQQEHLNDIDQEGVKNAMKIIKSTVNEYDNRFIVGEIGSDKIEVLKQYQSQDLLDVVFNFNFGSIKEFSTQRIFDELQSMEKNMSNYPTLFFGSHDMPRMIDRLADGNTDRATALAALILTAKGVPFIYYGEEIGMHNIMAKNINEMVDIQGRTHYQLAIAKGKNDKEALLEGNEHNRDKSRSPMQWNGEAFAGFSTEKSWIKISPNYKEINVAALKTQKKSILNSYKKLTALRNKEKVLQYGSYDNLELQGDQISFTRSFEGEKITIIINFGIKKEITLPANVKVLMGSKILKPNSFIIYKN